MSKYLLSMISLIVLLSLSGCGTIDLDVQGMSPAEATSQANQLATGTPPDAQNQMNGLLEYTNEAYGFFFSYPAIWTLEEQSNLVTLRREGVLLNISYKREADPIDIGGSGIPAGELKAGEPNSLMFLGHEVPKSVLVYEGKVTAILYGEPRQLANIQFAVRADLDRQASLDGEITKEYQDEIDQVIESIDLVWAALPLSEEAMQNWMTYANDDYGFQLRYPDSWTLEEIPGGEEAPGPPGSIRGESLTLANGTYTLYIGFKDVDEDLMIGWSGMGAGEFQKGNPMLALVNGQALSRTNVVYEERIKTVLYGEIGVEPITIEDLNFAIRLDDFAQIDYENIDLPQEIRDDADAIVTSIELTEQD